MVYSDLPTNDFNSVLSVLNHPDSTMPANEHSVYSQLVGRSFYEQVVPSNTLHIGFSSTAMHWLSKVPVPIPDHVFGGLSQDPVVKQAYIAQSRQDWRTICKHRGRELVPGGVFALNLLLEKEGPHEPPVCHVINIAAHRMLHEGIIDAKEMTEFCIPIYARPLSDMIDPDILAEAGLELISHRRIISESPYYNKYLETGSLAEFGREIAAHAESWTYSFVQDAFKEEAKIRLFYEYVCEEAQKKVELFRFSFENAMLIFRKL
eukprot:TRINITY_DN20347_c0_g1_i4.p1 TRINITY_DN20347_c0_g1~~TRINITY_DN20347_c0_g1_i4.p1  ORF type:complete len:263 (-),score=41.25 TRINITY_DN20347_c0_g1_i4:190-978(-)